MKNLLLILLLALLPTSLWAQNDNNTERVFWEATIPGGNYIVALDSITSVSSHAYILDGSMVVTEVNIDTNGAALARFYTLTPIAAYESADISNLFSEGVKTLEEIVDSADVGKTKNLTHKVYPTTTHAKTIEYQVTSLKNLSRLLKSVQRSFRNNTGATFSL